VVFLGQPAQADEHRLEQNGTDDERGDTVGPGRERRDVGHLVLGDPVGGSLP
jgi:hypothetical protein